MVRLLSLLCCLSVVIHSFSDDELHAESLVISEIVAGNKSTYPTQIEGQEVIPDWIEIHNQGFQAVDLSGWYLTDEITHLSKWPLPEITLEAGGYWVVYACGIQALDHPENTPFRDDLGRYHTNFELAGEGEFPALVTPDHTIAHAYTEHNGGYPINYFLTECI